jgi:simple sugar transport system ATP-binding protein
VSSTPLALSLRGIEKRFGSTTALDGADLDVRAGTLHALLGENGAGKTTLMRLAFGMLHPDGGEISVNGTARAWRSSADAIEAGIGMVHQHYLLVGAMTVAENVSLGDRGFFRAFDPAAAAQRVRRIGAETGLALDPSARVADLGVSAQQRVEIVKALARDATLLILDEPTAVLSPNEARELYAWLRGFVDQGRTVVLITHKIREALAIADDVTVLRRGKTTLTARAAALTEADVVTALVGVAESSENAGEREPARVGGVVMSLANVSLNDDRGVTRLRGVSVEVRAGEIVGVAGVEGSGHHELLQLLACRRVPSSGDVTTPRTIGFVPEDRLRDALIPEMSLVENLALKESGGARGILPWDSYALRAATTVQTYDVRTSGADAAAGSLSGGNQQKFVLGRELEGPPAALVVENPTRGLDIRATAHVLAELRRARNAGVAVIVYSSDLDEVLGLADRILVCFEGRVREVPNELSAVASAMVGAA